MSTWQLKPRITASARALLLAGLTLGILLSESQPVQAQDLAFGADGEIGRTAIGLMALLTLLGLVPGLAVMITCFPLIVTVMSILRQAIGLQQAPPNMLIISLALFLTWYVMDPVLTAAWTAGAGPFARGELPLETAIPRAWEPFRTFMEGRVDPEVLARMAGLRGESLDAGLNQPAVLVPSFLLSEIQRAFQIGFLVFIPFLVIDLIVAAVLMSMGMMMVPPAIVSLPFKLAFFVIADGWVLISEALVRGYS